MALSTWWKNDSIPWFAPIPNLLVTQVDDIVEQARINRLSTQEVQSRIDGGNIPYAAYLDGQPASYGWVGTRDASIGELDLVFSLPIRQHYLWDFATLPEFRGRGLYPRLLQGILQAEAPNADKFWIIHAPENLPSGAGIDRAGFEAVGQLSFRLEGGAGLKPFDNLERAQAGAVLLGLELIDAVLSPCWCCGAAEENHCGVEEAIACWPPVRPNAAVQCTCAIEIKKPNGR